MFRRVPLSINRSFSLYTQQWYMSYRFADSSRAVSKPVWHIPLLCVQWKTPDDGHSNRPKHAAEFHSKNKFEKLVHLVGFIIRNLTRCTVTWTSREVKNLSNIARKTWNNLVMIAYSWIQIQTEWAYVPLRLCDTIYSLFYTHGLFRLHIAVTFIIQLCRNIQYFIQDSFFGFRICLYIHVFRLSVFLFYMFSSAIYVFFFLSFVFLSYFVSFVVSLSRGV
jgi:hypothetical protein